MFKLKESKLFIRQRVKQWFFNLVFLFKHLGCVQPSVVVECPNQIKLGSNSTLGCYVRLYATPTSKIIIGSNSSVALGCKLLAFNEQGKLNENIIIGDNVFIGANAVILQGVKIGNNSVVGAGAVVTKGTIILPNELWVGVPARFKRVVS